jgi:hypothetical protein
MRDSIGLKSSVVVAAISVLALLLVGRVCMGCTGGAQTQTGVLTAEQDACEILVLATSVIPIGTDPSMVANDIKAGCGIVESATQYLISVVQAYMVDRADAGIGAPATAGPYIPSPFVKRTAKK